MLSRVKGVSLTRRKSLTKVLTSKGWTFLIATLTPVGLFGEKVSFVGIILSHARLEMLL